MNEMDNSYLHNDVNSSWSLNIQRREFNNRLSQMFFKKEMWSYVSKGIKREVMIKGQLIQPPNLQLLLKYFVSFLTRCTISNISRQ